MDKNLLQDILLRKLGGEAITLHKKEKMVFIPYILDKSIEFSKTEFSTLTQKANTKEIAKLALFIDNAIEKSDKIITGIFDTMVKNVMNSHLQESFNENLKTRISEITINS